jgi:hypothetical protein
MIRGSDKNSSNPLNTQELWQKIQMIAQKALDHPRLGRDSKTTAFYRNIVNDNIILLENEMNVENKFKLL